MAKNEADRYLPRVLERCLSFSDTVLVLDDRSTDDTPNIAKDLGCEVRTRSILKDPAWGHESSARQELWSWGAEATGDGWLLICDADQILHGDPRPLCDSWEVNSWAFVLMDMWSPTHFRTDGFWQAHYHPRPWMAKPSAFGPDFTPQWNGRQMHVGHFPPNAPLACGIAPPEEYWWEHLGYASPMDRERKFAQYQSVKDRLTAHEWAHAASIMDP